jgi:serine protease AprX
MLYQASYISQTDLATGTEDLKAMVSPISFYPNPADEYVYFENTQGVVTINIYDIKGALIRTAELLNGKKQIQVSDLNPGMYIIQLVSKTNIYTEKLIIE